MLHRPATQKVLYVGVSKLRFKNISVVRRRLLLFFLLDDLILRRRRKPYFILVKLFLQTSFLLYKASRLFKTPHQLWIYFNVPGLVQALDLGALFEHEIRFVLLGAVKADVWALDGAGDLQAVVKVVGLGFVAELGVAEVAELAGDALQLESRQGDRIVYEMAKRCFL